MSESPGQIKKHIAALTEFETKYGEYIRVHEEDCTASIAAGAIGAPDDLGSDMSAEDFAHLTRDVKMLATRADRAIRASGVAPLAGSVDVPAQAFDFEVNDGYFSDDGLGVPRELLERIPSQISGLEMKLEEAEAAEEEDGMRLLGELIEGNRERQRQTQERRDDRTTDLAQQPGDRASERERPWWENPWVVGIGVTVIGGMILAGIIALMSAT
jgi:hypothetical protein